MYGSIMLIFMGDLLVCVDIFDNIFVVIILLVKMIFLSVLFLNIMVSYLYCGRWMLKSVFCYCLNVVYIVVEIVNSFMFCVGIF